MHVVGHEAVAKHVQAVLAPIYMEVLEPELVKAGVTAKVMVSSAPDAASAVDTAKSLVA